MLKKGNYIRYNKIGAGMVVKIITRKFLGEEREFAVINFPHQNMKTQLPLGDPIVTKNVFEITPLKDLQTMLKHMHTKAELMPRTWNSRKEESEKKLKQGNPEDWIEALGSYAVADGAGVPITASDKTLVQELKIILSAEYSCSSDGLPMNEAEKIIEKYYKEATKQVKKIGYEADHFETMEVLPDFKKVKSKPRKNARLLSLNSS